MIAVYFYYYNKTMTNVKKCFSFQIHEGMTEMMHVTKDSEHFYLCMILFQTVTVTRRVV